MLLVYIDKAWLADILPRPIVDLAKTNCFELCSNQKEPNFPFLVDPIQLKCDQFLPPLCSAARVIQLGLQQQQLPITERRTTCQVLLESLISRQR